jgi:hypothetical protein
VSPKNDQVLRHPAVREPILSRRFAQAIRAALDGHSHTYIPGSNTPTATTGNPAVPAPTGTQKFKAE